MNIDEYLFAKWLYEYLKIDFTLNKVITFDKHIIQYFSFIAQR